MTATIAAPDETLALARLASVRELRTRRAYRRAAQVLAEVEAKATAQQARVDERLAAHREHLSLESMRAPECGSDAIARSERQRSLRAALEVERWHLDAIRRELEAARQSESQKRRAWSAARDRQERLAQATAQALRQDRRDRIRGKDRSAEALVMQRASGRSR